MRAMVRIASLAACRVATTWDSASTSSGGKNLFRFSLRALELAPQSVKAYAMRAQVRLQAVANDDALNDAEQALALSPEDVLKLNLAREVGTISLALRKFNDNKPNPVTTVTAEDVRRGTDSMAKAPPVAKRSNTPAKCAFCRCC